MTVSSTTTSQAFACNGVTTAFTLPYRVLEASAVHGYLTTISTGEVVELENGTDFTVSAVGESNAIATTTTAYSSSYSIRFKRVTARLQETDYRDNDPFPAESHETGLDRVTMIAQEIGEDIERTVRVPSGESIDELPTASARASKLLGFNSIGEMVAVAPADGSAASLALSLASEPPGNGADMVVNKKTAIGAVAESLHLFLEGQFFCATDFDGLVDDGVADDYTVLQAAIDAAAAARKGLYLNVRNCKYTTTLEIPEGLTWMFGDGQGTVLKPTGCHGIELTNQTTYAGARMIGGFMLDGQSASSYSGIYAQMTAASGHRVTGIEFSNITIQGFGYAINTAGLWNCTFREVFGYANHQGVRLWNRNINTTFAGCRLIKGTSPGGAGTRYAFQLVVDSGVRTEGTHIHGGTYTAGWDVGAHVSNSLHTTIENCEFDICVTYGIQATTANGGCAIRNNWINILGGAAGTGVKLDALGAAIYDSVVVEGNQITCTSAFAGTIGVAVGVNQAAARVLDNRISGFDVGIDSDAANFVERDNTINATTTAIVIDSAASLNNSIGPSHIQSGTALAFSSGSSQPAGLMYWAKGQFTMALTGCTAGVNATVDWHSLGGAVALSMTADATGTSNATTMTGTGMPQAIRPAANKSFQAICVDNGTGAVGRAVITASSGVVTFYKDVDGGAFTNSGTKGLRQSTLTYTRG